MKQVLGDATLYLGDCREVLQTLPAGLAQTCVTSPPYYGLRDYGTATWDGGDPVCDHRSGRFERGGLSSKQASNHGRSGDEARTVCPKCGARRIDAQIGLEPTLKEYVEQLVAVFREVRRVLRDDGTLWLNLGDSYANNAAAGDKRFGNPEFNKNRPSREATKTPAKIVPPGLKPKDLVGIPWRVAFALQADGWYLRQDIIWSKPNPMPESVTDRCTKAHEYLFLLAKSERYYYDAEAIKEKSAYAGKVVVLGEKSLSRGQAAGGNVKATGNGLADSVTVTDNRNRRSVWTVATRPYKDAHFATYPPELIEPCIMACTKFQDIVLDPFNGSGTTGLVALLHGRRYVGCELNKDYFALTIPRVVDAQRQLLMFQ